MIAAAPAEAQTYPTHPILMIVPLAPGGSTDAEGRVLLADKYDSLLDDRAGAEALLQEAWRIDPQSKEVADAFRRRGFHKLNDRWVLSQNREPSGSASGGMP